jgi:NAD(P)H-flavin reductase
MSLAAAGSMHEAMQPAPARVRQVRRETADTVTLTLEPPDAAPAFAFAPGQFNMVYAFGVGEIPISMSGDPGRPDRIVHTVRAVGAVSHALCGARRGDALGIRGPYGQPWPLDPARGGDVLVIAGGLGLAPLRPLIYALQRDRDSYGAVALLVGGRAPNELLFRGELARWGRRRGIQVLVTVDRAGAEWTGRVGVVTQLIADAAFDPQRTTAFLCGPEVMMRFAARELGRHAVPDERIYCSLERNMKCAIGFCGHCQFGPAFVCKDGPVFRYDRVRPLLAVREI